MSEPAEVIDLFPATEKKDLYALGEFPPLGHVPKKMHAWAICHVRCAGVAPSIPTDRSE